MTKKQKHCFVIMGFGIKTDYASGKVFDLDKTYQHIIKPTTEALGFKTIRADEISQSAIIDVNMYKLLLESELVIADISTGNVNAVYELGVRHALRPYTTIIMNEMGGTIHFDHSHNNIFKYKHLGEDIGHSEVIRARDELKNLIITIDGKSEIDSPVYTYLPRLNQDLFRNNDLENFIDKLDDENEKLSDLILKGNLCIKDSDFENARICFEKANSINSNDDYLIQRLTLSIYKSKKPSEEEALYEALKIINVLSPQTSNDPETIGLTGAIYKRLWLFNRQISNLDDAIKYYRRGFEIKKDYYNGVNLAQCYEYKMSYVKGKNEKIFYSVAAEKVREDVLKICDEIIRDTSFEERSDQKWVFATISHCALSLKDFRKAEEAESKFYSYNPADWEIETYEQGKQNLLILHEVI